LAGQRRACPLEAGGGPRRRHRAVFLHVASRRLRAGDAAL